MAAGVAGVEVVPVLNPFFGWVPAEEDNASSAFVREVEQAHIQVLEDDAERVLEIVSDVVQWSRSPRKSLDPRVELRGRLTR